MTAAAARNTHALATRRHERVIIIGAGFAGLAAAKAKSAGRRR
jgi:cation diffusion facilitator CzcD-associated flavoprotein CzcO